MEKPQIVIINSGVYNNTIRKWLGKDDYLTKEELGEYRQALVVEWEKIETETLNSIISSIGWPWEEKLIRCYVTGTRASFSDPLTLGYKKNINLAVDVLTHELIHRYISQQIPDLRKKILDFYENYPDENRIVQNHIMVHAIHEHVYRAANKLERLEADISLSQSAPDYAKAWQIVSEVGYRAILKKIAPSEILGA